MFIRTAGLRRSISLRVCTPPLWREAFPQASKPCSAICCLRKRKATHHACSTAWTRRPPALCSHPVPMARTPLVSGRAHRQHGQAVPGPDRRPAALRFHRGRRLDTDTRNKTRVRHTDDPDPVRHTDVTLLAPLTAGDVPGLVESDDPDAPLMLVAAASARARATRSGRISPLRGTRWPEIPSMRGIALPLRFSFASRAGLVSRFPSFRLPRVASAASSGRAQGESPRGVF